jgi:hypothetical protein
MVVVNPSGASGTLRLGSGSYKLSGHVVSSVSLAAHSGVVLTS